MLKAIDRCLPSKVSLDVPSGGLFIWLRLPESLSAEELLPFACKEGVAFVPGKYFFTDDTNGDEWIRLNFVSQPIEDIEEGIRRLGVAIRKMKARK
jgi:2-aminoadipate transaminase